MSGDKKNDIDWQSELKSRLEAYEKRTGRRISGKKNPKDFWEEEDMHGSVSDFSEESVVIPGKEEAGDLEDESEIENPAESFYEEENELEDDYPVEPDFLAVLDGLDGDDDVDSFLFRERLSRDTDSEDDFDITSLTRSGSGSDKDRGSYFDEIREDSDEEEELCSESVVKVVNIEEFRMDSSAEEVFVPLKDESPLGYEDEFEPSEEEEVSKEIIVSRLLSGMIDMVIAVITAAGFMEIAAWKLSLNFFEVGVLKWIGILAVFFYILNCLYFLTLTHRTPGMLITDLKLHPGKGRDTLSFLSVLVRTLAFFPSALCVTGLVWALFDYQARCLHDIISGTRVVSARG
ncbi:MAG: RDD family protein [Acidobacteriota bacterium]